MRPGVYLRYKYSFFKIHSYLICLIHFEIIYVPAEPVSIWAYNIKLYNSNTYTTKPFQYAAIEDEFDEDPSCLLSCFRPLSVAGFSCPRELRDWYWHKLVHFERLNYKYVEPVRRYLSVVWGMPELLTQGFESRKQTSLENPNITLTADDIDTAAKTVVAAGDCERSEEPDTE